LHNFRDFGGYRTADGRQVRWGQLYRSDSLSKLAGNDLARFAEVGVRTVIDLRHSWEIDKWGRVPQAAELAYHNFSIEHRPYDQSILTDVVDPVRFLADRYAEVASDGVAEIGLALRVIAAGTFGSVREYVTGYLGVEETAIAELRALYITA
jgi:protein-tyrosine phosphatase